MYGHAISSISQHMCELGMVGFITLESKSAPLVRAMTLLRATVYLGVHIVYFSTHVQCTSYGCIPWHTSQHMCNLLRTSA
jgi:hypothetical protein